MAKITVSGKQVSAKKKRKGVHSKKKTSKNIGAKNYKKPSVGQG